MTKLPFERTFAVEDMSIRAGSDGRTVTAYAAVFNTPVEVHDFEGHYVETIDRAAFDRTISHGPSRFQVLFNHGRDVHGNASERYSMPVATPLVVRADGRGVLTEVRYARTPLGDEVLELIKSGAIRGQSFSGTWIRSQHLPSTRSSDLPTKVRLEVAMREFGPTPFPVYSDADMVGVRSQSPVPSLDLFERRLHLAHRKAQL